MNTIKPNSFKKSSIKLSVKVGSHVVNINASRDTTCNDLIKMALKECKISSLAKNYALLERANGIERMISNEQIIFKILLDWKVNQPYELVVKLCKKIATNERMLNRSDKSIHKIFRIGREKYNEANHRASLHEINLYERIEYTTIDSPKYNHSRIINRSQIKNEPITAQIIQTKEKRKSISFPLQFLIRSKSRKRALDTSDNEQDSKSTDLILKIFYLV
jgi:hypothetical protein